MYTPARDKRSMKSMNAIVAVFILCLVLAGCASGPSALNEKTGLTRWSPPPFPSSPPPIEGKGHFGLPPPRYPYPEKHAGIRGEVLLEIVVDENHHVAAWKVLRATTDGYARSVLATMSKDGQVPGIPAGVYLHSVVFSGDDLEQNQSRPATFWITTDNFGSKWSRDLQSEGTQRRLSDKKIRGMLVGTWIVSLKRPGGSMDGTVVLDDNGTLIGEAVFSHGEEQTRINYKAKWKIEEATLVESITDASNPAMIGLVTRDKVVALDDNEYIYRTKNDEIVRRVRKKEK